MRDNICIIITSIAGPNDVMREYAQGARKKGWDFMVIGDSKSPVDFYLDGCDFWSLQRQYEMNFGLARELPKGHYSRKNLGYLKAISGGTNIIIETDDDNMPYESFWEERKVHRPARQIGNEEWINVYSYFTDNKIWPRGFPLEKVQQTTNVKDNSETVKTYAPIQQGLANGDPDVDAVYRLIMPLPFNFRNESPVSLKPGSFCPFNSQNTTWFREAFPLMYLPSYCSFRMTDIWRSLVAQSISRHYGWQLLFHSPTVSQDRNFHDLLRDLKDEFPGYLENDRIIKILNRINFSPMGNAGENLLMAYESLVGNNIIPEKEIRLVNLWLEDLRKTGKG